MSVSTFEVFECDRCGAKAERQAGASASLDWGSIRAAAPPIRPGAAARSIGVAGAPPADLCTSCCDSLFVWLSSRDEEQRLPSTAADPRQASAAPPPPPAPRRDPEALNFNDRAFAAGVVEQAMLDHVREIVARIRERPTSILNDDDLPDIEAGAREKALRAVAVIVDRLRLRKDGSAAADPDRPPRKRKGSRA
jgi:hypothetical protein